VVCVCVVCVCVVCVCLCGVCGVCVCGVCGVCGVCVCLFIYVRYVISRRCSWLHRATIISNTLLSLKINI